jgi:hypothetical protein
VQHGDIMMRLALRGEPQKLFTYWRGPMRDILPTEAAVTILKMNKRPPSSPWWSDRNPDFHFEAMTQTEKKRAELSISDHALSMTAPEIETARYLTDITFAWMSSRDPLPTLNQPISNARLSFSVEGSPVLVEAVEQIGDPEVVSSATIGAVYTPRELGRPDTRWLPTARGIDKSAILSELKSFESQLIEGQASEVRRGVDRVSGVFRKALNLRRARLNKRITEVLGYSRELQIGDRTITDDMIEDHRFTEIMDWLDAEAARQKSRSKIRAWRVK